jgi:hypothetical protein
MDKFVIRRSSQLNLQSDSANISTEGDNPRELLLQNIVSPVGLPAADDAANSSESNSCNLHSVSTKTATSVSKTGVLSSSVCSTDDSDVPHKVPKMCSDDIGDFLGKEGVSFEKQRMLTQKWTPSSSNFVWPSSAKREKGKVINRHLMQSHIDRYPQFAYRGKACNMDRCVIWTIYLFTAFHFRARHLR